LSESIKQTGGFDLLTNSIEQLDIELNINEMMKLTKIKLNLDATNVYFKFERSKFKDILKSKYYLVTTSISSKEAKMASVYKKKF